MFLFMLTLVCVFASSVLTQQRSNCGPARNNCGKVGTSPHNTRHVCCCQYIHAFQPYNVSGMFVDCSRRNLNAVPNELPSNATFLDMSHNHITGQYLISDRPFRQFSNLTVLFLAYNKIFHITEKSFYNLGNLLFLDITMIYIRYDNKSISPTAFRQLKSLRNLRMKQSWHNFTEEETYPDTALSELITLDTLHIDAMPDTPFPDGFRKLTNLIYIILNHDCCRDRCNVPRIDKSTFQNMPHLHYIAISVCNVRHIMYDALGSLRNLTRLNLNWNDKLTFKCMYNLTSGLRTTKIDKLWLIGIHDYYSGCNMLTAEHLQFLSETKITHLVIGSNRISGFTWNATNYIPKTLKYLSLTDNMFLYGDYVKKIFNQNLLPNLWKLIISNQFESKVPGNLPPYNAEWQQRKPGTYTAHGLTDFEENPGEIQEFGCQNQRERLSPPHSLLDNKHAEEERNRDSLTEYKCPETVTCMRLPKFLGILNLANMRMRMPIQEYNLTTQPNILTELYMNRNMFLKWHGPITGFNALQTLDLSENGCDFVSNMFFYDMPELRFLNASYNYLGESLASDEYGMVFYKLHKLKTLDLTNNEITNFPKKIFSGLENLEKLNVQDNHLIEFDTDMDHIRKLSFLDLSGNALSSLPVAVTDHLDKQASAGNMTVNLMHNHIKCDCEHQTFLQWMLDTNVYFYNMSTYNCTDKDQQQQKLTRYELRTNILPRLSRQCYNYAWVYISASAVVTLIIGSITSSAIYRNRYRLYYLYYKLKLGLHDNSPVNGYQPLNKRDVNISYADTDADWTFVDKHVRNELENKFSLYDHYVNGKLGEYEAENIIEGIIKSRKTLVILTKDYVRQRYCRFIINMVRETAIDRNEKIMYFMLKGITANTLGDICNDAKLVSEIVRMMNDVDVRSYPCDGCAANELEGFWGSVREQLEE